jgi:hypothetical protein
MKRICRVNVFWCWLATFDPSPVLTASLVALCPTISSLMFLLNHSQRSANTCARAAAGSRISIS